MTTILNGFFSKIVGKFLGKFITTTITSALFDRQKQIIGKKQSGFDSQPLGFGKDIPIIFGTMKVNGALLWQSKVVEHAVINTKFINLQRVEEEKYHYTISLLIGICQGPISSIGRVWVNDQPLSDLSNFRFYYGKAEQEPDPLIATIYGGKDKVPNYKNLAYLVIENFNITPFNNEIPQFTFEVFNYSAKSTSLEKQVKSLIIIPGCGEFVYDTDIQYENGQNIKAINQHHQPGVANAVISLHQIAQSLPEVEWVAPVVAWFCDDLNIKNCNIKPGVENIHIKTFPDEWKVSNFTRQTAHQITQLDDQVNYGGTISDASIIRYLHAIRAKNYKVMFYPMLFIDTPDKPWRGRITGEVSSITRFFQQYRDFILHYATLTKGLVDAFLIGSEMEGLTQIQAKDGSFPAIKELQNLAFEAKKILGPDVKISYAANWSEYHSYQGLYNMDDLWSSDAIDFIGIDAYFPLSNSKNSVYNHQDIMHGWDTGEGYDFYYDQDVKKPLKIAQAWKNINHWWNNLHYNPDGSQTSWRPGSKKIWFTEYGFPSISCSTNQPNLFFDHSSIESSIPRYSNGKVDILAQRKAIEATEMRWQQSEIVERRFLWCWDARPYPTWPNLQNVWADTKNWARGHWINGKTGILELKEVIQNLWLQAELDLQKLDVTKLEGIVQGLKIENYQSLHEILLILKQIYQFQIVEIGHKIHFISDFNNTIQLQIDKSHLISQIECNEDDYGITQKDLIINAKQNQLYNILISYYTHNLEQAVLVINNKSDHKIQLEIPCLLSKNDINTIAQRALYNYQAKNTNFDFLLTVEKFCVDGMQVGKIIVFENNKLIVTAIKFLSDCLIKITAQPYNNDINTIIGLDVQSLTENHTLTSTIDCSLLKVMPANFAANNIKLLIGGYNNSWHGCNIYYSALGQKNNIYIKNGSYFGEIIEYQSNCNCNTLIDRKSLIKVKVYSGQLETISEIDLFNSNKNLAIIDNEIIKFQIAELQADGSYLLKNLIREIYGTKTISFRNFILIEEEKIITIPSSEDLSIQIQTQLDSTKLNYGLEKKYHLKANYFTELQPSNIQIIRDKIIWTPRSITNDFFANSENMQFYIEILDVFGKTLMTDITNKHYYLIPSNIEFYKLQIAVYQNQRIVSEKVMLINPIFA